MDTPVPTSDSPAARASDHRRIGWGRLVLVTILAAYAVVVLYPHLGSYSPHWQRVGVFDAPVPFADMRSLTSAWDCTRQGQEVLVHNHCDPLGWRPANYPTLWLRLSVLGLGQGATTALGLGVGLAFLASVFLLTGRIGVGSGLLWGALVVSPSVMLGVNRGNVDLLLFALLAVALAALTRRRRSLQVVGCALIELAAWLKLFPIFASVAVLRWPRRRALAAFGALAAVFAAYALDRRHELETIRRVVPAKIDLSFGAGVVVDALRRTYGDGAFLIANRLLAIALLGLATLLVALVVAPLLARRRPADPEPSTRLPWFWAGAAVYLGTWAFTENSFDYRLAFLLFTVPQLLEWAGQSRPALPFARTALALLVAAFWLSDTVQPISWTLLRPWLAAESHFPFDELLVWTLAVYVAAGLVVTRPAWLRVRVPLPRPSEATAD